MSEKPYFWTANEEWGFWTKKLDSWLTLLMSFRTFSIAASTLNKFSLYISPFLYSTPITVRCGAKLNKTWHIYRLKEKPRQDMTLNFVLLNEVPILDLSKLASANSHKIQRFFFKCVSGAFNDGHYSQVCSNADQASMLMSCMCTHRSELVALECQSIHRW